MYVVRRSFRNYGDIMVPGSTVEPSTIKRFKSRLADGHIIEVTEQNFEKWREVFKIRYGVTLQRIEEAIVEEAPTKETPLEEPVTQKAVTKKVVAAKVKTIK